MRKLSFTYFVNLFFTAILLIFVIFAGLFLSVFLGKTLEAIFCFKFTDLEAYIFVLFGTILSLFIFFKLTKINLKGETFGEFIDMK